jgi:hypothetical protein
MPGTMRIAKISRVVHHSSQSISTEGMAQFFNAKPWVIPLQSTMGLWLNNVNPIQLGYQQCVLIDKFRSWQLRP